MQLCIHSGQKSVGICLVDTFIFLVFPIFRNDEVLLLLLFESLPNKLVQFYWLLLNLPNDRKNWSEVNELVYKESLSHLLSFPCYRFGHTAQKVRSC